MTRHHFSFKDAFVFGWTKTKQHYWFTVLTFIMVTLIINATNHVPLLRTLTSMMAALSIASVSLLIVRNQHFTFESLFAPLLSPKKVCKFIAITALYAIPVLLTAIFLYFVPAKLASLIIVIPSVYLAVRLKFFPYMVIEHEDASLRNLIEMSFKLTKNHFWMVFVFLLLLGALNVLGAMFFVVGLLVTVPVSIFATAYVYDRLKEHTV